MKKKLFSILLSLAMVVTMMPMATMTAFAGTDHDLTVTKNDGSAAVLGTDYEWDSTDSNKLIILQDGLKVSGTSSKENIVVSDTVSNITLSDLNISTDKEDVVNFAVENIESMGSITTPLTITIDGAVVLENKNTGDAGYAFVLSASTTINGEGSLSISDIKGTPIVFADGIEFGGAVNYIVVSEKDACFQYSTSDDEEKVAPTSIPIKISTTGTTSLSAKTAPLLLLSMGNEHADFEATKNAGDVLLMTTSNELPVGAITTSVGEDCADCTINLNNKNIFGSVNINETKENVKDQIEYKLNSDFGMSSYYVGGNLDTPARTILIKTSSKPEPTPVVDTTVPVELVNATTSGSRAVKLSWTAVPGATKYEVYGQKCGKNYKKLTTTSKTSYKVKKIKGKKLKAHKTYKFYVRALTPNGYVQSNSIHFITGKKMGKYANAKSITVNPSTVTLEEGKTVTLKATTKIYKNKKHIKKSHGAATRYVSDNPTVASVNANGVVTANKEGTATIYVQDIGGLWCKTVVTVKAAEPSIKYTVTFDLNGITGEAPKAQTINEGDKVTKPADPTDTIHTFEGWYKTKDATTGELSDPWNFDTNTVTADMTLYAKWDIAFGELMKLQSDFPNTLDKAWVNASGHKLYLGYSDTYSQNALMNENGGAWVYSSYKLSKVANGYKYEYDNGEGWSFSFTFILDGTQITSIELVQSNTDDYCGTYAPADSCFVAGTQVQYDLVGNTKNIEDFKVGDDIVSYNVNTGEYYLAKVNRLFIHDGAQQTTQLVDMTLENGTVITMTANHPILTQDGFKSVSGKSALTADDKVLVDGEWIDISVIKVYSCDPTTTYNIDVIDLEEIEDDNTIDTYIAGGTVVHNKPE